VAALGILGGTFDPVHNAHLALAHGALRHLSLDKVLFLPTGSPHYRTPAVATPEHRVAMLQLALAGEPRFELDARELAPGATGYTVDTLRALREEIGPQTPLYFLMGADQLGKLESWHRPDEVRKLARIAAFARPGFALPDGGAERVPLSPMDVSASEIRARSARGDDLSGMVPPAVANYIARHNLYR
jgi:nicotinate-nucleotide adenylyltransferase